MKVWREGRGIEVSPCKSSLSRLRKKISYRFFKEHFERLIRKVDPVRSNYLGYRIYAVDGQMLTLPKSAEIAAAGFTGRAVSKYRESHYPKGFLTHAYDVLTGVTKDFKFTNRLHEQEDAEELMSGFEKNSITLYDRLYFGVRLVRAHYKYGHHFLFRCRGNACGEVKAFFGDPAKPITATFFMKGKYEVNLVRVYDKKSKREDVFATSLPIGFLNPKLIAKLYRLRWEVETSFLELTGITKAEQWHSKSVNGILQELYARFWLINYTKIEIHVRTKKPSNPLKDEYERPNFKLLYNFVLLMFPKIMKRNQKVLADFEWLRKKSLERRKHRSRKYKREIKRPASPYKYNNCKWVWDA